MAENYQEIYIICKNCNGTEVTIHHMLDPLTGAQTDETYEVECPDCEGKGKVLWGYLKIT